MSTTGSRKLRGVVGLLLQFGLVATLAPAVPVAAQSPVPELNAPNRAKPAQNVMVVTSDGRSYRVGSLAEAVQADSPAVNAGFAGSEPNQVLAPSTGSTLVPDSVIGRDDRIAVGNLSRAYPYRAIAYLDIRWRDGSSDSCTGWFVGPRTVVTAAHCVYDNDQKHTTRRGWIAQVTAYPGRNGSSIPFGSSTGHRLFTTESWTKGGTAYQAREYDYGAIQLDAPLGNQVGWFATVVANDAWLNNRGMILTGYPCDKPTATLWTATDSIKRVEAKRFFYAIDTYGCQSGSPVYTYDVNTPGCTPCVAGIHTNDVNGDPPRNQYNSATRITQEVRNYISSWINYAYP